MQRLGCLAQKKIDELREKHRPHQRTIQRDLYELQSVGFVSYDPEYKRWFLARNNKLPVPISKNESLAALILRSNLSVFEEGIFKTEFSSIDEKLNEIYFNKKNVELGKIFENIDFGNYNYPNSDLIKTLLNSIVE